MKGLTAAEAQSRLERFGPNALPEAARISPWRRFFRQLKSPLIYILILALAVDILVWARAGGDHVPIEGLAIAVILLLNAGLGMWQERKAEKALVHLAALAAPSIWTWRDGELVKVPSQQLVPGDVIRLEAGERVPADAVLRQSDSVSVDESVLTGESYPVAKEAEDECLTGTLIVRGRGYAEVLRTGSQSAMGRVASILGTVQAEPTPLERRLEKFAKQMARWVIVLAVVIAVAGVAVEGFANAGQVLLFAVALAVAAVPEGLPAILTFTLAIGVERMARRKAVVRKLAAVEALGSVTVIATDKTGTLTENQLEVRGLDSHDQVRAIRAMVLANDAEIDSDAGDPLEVALLSFAASAGNDPATLRKQTPRVSSRPFDSQWGFMRATVRENGAVVSYLKGAPEVVLSACSLPPEARDEIIRNAERRAQEGLRLLGLAGGPGERETELEWLGLVALWDPPRQEVPDAIKRAQQAGIRVLMITGDHPATAVTVAQSVGLTATKAITGGELDYVSDQDLRAIVTEHQIFARVTAEHKLRIVKALQAEGEIVAVTGDGVNDAPALKRSNVGIAMGERGSDVAREVADLVILDDNFTTIVAAVEEGRGIYESIQTFIRFLLSTNLSELLVVTLGSIAAFLLELRDGSGGLLVPLTAAQLLWINLVTDGAPALALGIDRSPDVMNRLPRNPQSPLLDVPSRRFVLLSGAAKALVAFGILVFLPILGQPTDVTQTATFLFLAAGQLWFAYPARRTDLRPPRNVVLHVAVFATLAVQLLVVIAPWLRSALGTVPLPPLVMLGIFAATFLSWGAAEIVSRLLWRSGNSAPAKR